MVNIKKIRELYIESDTFNTLDKSKLREKKKKKWEDYIVAL
jgi:hypothetical protein